MYPRHCQAEHPREPGRVTMTWHPCNCPGTLAERVRRFFLAARAVWNWTAGNPATGHRGTYSGEPPEPGEQPVTELRPRADGLGAIPDADKAAPIAPVTFLLPGVLSWPRDYTSSLLSARPAGSLNIELATHRAWKGGRGCHQRSAREVPVLLVGMLATPVRVHAGIGPPTFGTPRGTTEVTRWLLHLPSR